MEKPVATVDFYETRIAKLEEEKKDLIAQCVRQTTNWSTESNRHRDAIDSLREWTVTELADEDITEGQAERLAEIGGFELVSEFEVTVTVEYNITVLAQSQFKISEIIDEIDFDTVSYSSDSILWFNAEVQSVDY